MMKYQKATALVTTRSLVKALRAGALTVTLCAGGTTISWAQREPKPEGNIGFILPAPHAGMDDGAPRVRAMTPQDLQRMSEEMRQLQQMTPHERQQYLEARMQEEYEQLLREAMERAGLNEVALQNTVVAFIREEEAARAPLRKHRATLAASLRGAHGDDKETRSAVVNWRRETVAAKERYAAALKELDAKVEYSKKPRLEALLTTLGLLDDASVTTSGPLVPGMLGLLRPQPTAGGFSVPPSGFPPMPR